jgi:DNA-binding transcriptional regulator YiaG
MYCQKVNGFHCAGYDVEIMGRKPKSPRRNPYGAWLHHLRKERDLSQRELSELTGIPQRNLAYWERSGKLKGRAEILKLAKALKIPVQELLRVEKE